MNFLFLNEKERAKEDHKFADKKKYVTSGYKEKLKADKEWEAQQALKDARDGDVTKKKNGLMVSMSFSSLWVVL